jgi:uncharacterized protein (TIGR03086 family)
VTPLDDISPSAAFALLERAISYTLGTVQAVNPDSLPAPTPCRGWDLHTLLHHVNESLELLHGCVDTAVVGATASAQPTTDPRGAFRARATQLVAAFSSRRPAQQVVIAGGYPLAIGVVATTGALEMAVHGWDISRATHQAKPIPSELASDLLWVCPLLAVDARLHRLFAPPVPIPPMASASDRLVASLGRDPAPSATPRAAR